MPLLSPIAKPPVRRVHWRRIIPQKALRRQARGEMKTLATLEPLIEKLRDIYHLNSAASLLSWDQETYMPPGGGVARAEHLATLQRLAHDRLVSPDIESLLGRWLDPATGRPLEPEEGAWSEPARALLREVWRDFNRAKRLPSAFVERLGRECSLAQQVWTEARKKSDFALFLPNLRTVVALKREEAEHLGYQDSPYDALLDTYEPGTTAATLRSLFESLRARLVPLLRRVTAAPAPDETFLYRTYGPARQVEFGKLVLTAMGYDFDRGRHDLLPSDRRPDHDPRVREGAAGLPVRVPPRGRARALRPGPRPRAVRHAAGRCALARHPRKSVPPLGELRRAVPPLLAGLLSDAPPDLSRTARRRGPGTVLRGDQPGEALPDPS